MFNEVYKIRLFEMLLINRFISKRSLNGKISLLLLYPTYYLTYLFSGMREGLVLSLFLGIAVELLIKQKYVKYEFMCIALAGIHSAAIVLCVLPLIKVLSTKTMMFAIIAALLIGLAGPLWVNRIRIGSISSYTGTSALSLSAILYRTISSGLILIAYHNANGELDDETLPLIKVYVTGLIIFCVFLRYPLLASRLSAVLCSVEVAVIPGLLCRGLIRQQRVVLLVVIALTMVMTGKNLGSYVTQGNYLQPIKWYNYPYISVFNKEELYRVSNGRYIVYTLDA